MEDVRTTSPTLENPRDFIHRSLPATPPSDGISSRVSSLCPHCGVETYGHIFPQDAQERIVELESQVRLLTGKAASAVDKLADYEAELRKLKVANGSPALTPSSATYKKEYEPLPPIPSNGEDTTLYDKRPSTATNALAEEKKPAPITTLGRFSSFRLTRKTSAPLNTTQSAPPTPPLISTGPSVRETELSAELAQEKNAREVAEKKVSAMSTELEELTSTLFQQANEMVADERRARAKLEERAQKFEERCETLEDKVKVLEKRDADKKRRLERLEEGIKRVERIRGLLQTGVR